VRKIKLEPVLALATQALGWVKTEMPGDIIKKMYDKHSQKNSTGNDSINFWIYGDTLHFCSIANNRSLSEARLIFEQKSVRGINEINILFKEWLKNSIPDILNIATSGQEISKKKLSEYQD
jgi:hypothetical protein